MRWYIQAFCVSDGRPASGPDWRPEATPDLLARLQAQAEALAGVPVALYVCDEERAPVQPGEAWEGLLATVVDGQVSAIALDPDWQPPEPSQPATDDTAQRLAALEAVVAGNLLASPHDRRWLAQKEAAKGVMAWMQANPACDQAQVEAQVAAAMQAATPGEPVVIAAAGLVQSYAEEAARRGLVPAASFEGLKALVLASSPEQLRQMLAVL